MARSAVTPADVPDADFYGIGPYSYIYTQETLYDR